MRAYARLGVGQPDGTSRTREVKLVTIWSTEGHDKEGTPVRDPGLGQLFSRDRERSAAESRRGAERICGTCSARGHSPSLHADPGAPSRDQRCVMAATENR
jgi:hypothetical protein